MNPVKLPFFVPAFLLLAGTLFLSACSETLVGDETPSVQELEGSVGEPVVITAGKTASNAAVDFDDLGPVEFVDVNRYAAQGVQVKIVSGDSRSSVRGSPGNGGPCDGTRALFTIPQRLSILFNFTEPVSSVSIDAGDYGPNSDSDVMTLDAYSEVDGGGAVVGEDTQTLWYGHETGCLGLSVSASGIRSVIITSAGPNPNTIFVDNLDFVSNVGPYEVDIDIKPGSDPNSINTKSKGNIPVAVLGSASFDVNDIDRSTLAFGPGGATPVHNDLGHLEDVNNDGFTDLVSHYKTQDTGLAVGDTEACVTGMTTEAFEGCDSVRIVR